MQLPSRISGILLLVFILISSNSCNDIQESEVPDIPFSFLINLITDNELTIPGNSKYYPYAGYGGVIVYCETPESYYAYDATCTYEVSKNCRLVNNSVEGECTCCKSKFIFLGGGYPIKGQAVAPLRQYQVSMVNSFTLRVYN
jgi:Rieske Fe-S protein